MATVTEFYYRLEQGGITRYYASTAAPTLSTVYNSATDREVSKAVYDAADLTCTGTDEVDTAPAITQFFLTYSSAGLKANLVAGLATEVRLTRADGVAVPSEGIYRATSAVGSQPAFPASGQYAYTWATVLPGIEYIVTAHPTGNTTPAKYLTQRITIPGTVPPAPVAAGINSVGAQYTPDGGLVAFCDASVYNEIRVRGQDVVWGNTGWASTGAPYAGAVPAGSGSYARGYGNVANGTYIIDARPTGETDSTKWLTAYFTVVNPVAPGANLTTGYRWDGAPGNYSFYAYAAVPDTDTYEFYAEPLDGQVPPTGSFVFRPMATTSETNAGVTVNRVGNHAPIFQGGVGVAPGNWNLHVQKTGRPETRDSRPMLLIGNQGSESDMGDGVANTKPIWKTGLTPPPLTPGAAWEWKLVAGDAYNPNNSPAGIFIFDTQPVWMSSTIPSANALTLSGTPPTTMTTAPSIDLNAVGTGGQTAKSFVPALNASAPTDSTGSCPNYRRLTSAELAAMPFFVCYEYANTSLPQGPFNNTVRAFNSEAELRQYMPTQGNSSINPNANFDFFRATTTSCNIGDVLYNDNRTEHRVDGTNAAWPVEAGWWGFALNTTTGVYTILRTNACGTIIERKLSTDNNGVPVSPIVDMSSETDIEIFLL